METFRIAWFNWKCIKHPEAGGAERFTHEVARRLVNKGYEVMLITSKCEGLPAEEKIEGYEVLRTGSIYTVYFKAGELYVKKLKSKVDLIVDEVNTLPFFTVKYVRKPVVTLIHQLAREYWLLEVKPPLSWMGYALEPKYLSLYKNTTAITVSESTKRDLERLGFRRIYVVPEGLNIKPLEKVPEKNYNPVIISVGRLKKTKRPDHAIKAFKLVAEKVLNARLLMVGGGPLKHKLEKLVKELGLDGKVALYGKVDEEEKVRLLTRAHVLVFPAVREGWGLVVTEANACGTPTVGYDVAGLRDSIKHGETGILVPPGDIKALAKALTDILMDNGLREKLSRNALEYAKQFDWDKTTEEFMKVMKNLS